MFRNGEETNRQRRRHKLLCIDNHASSTYLGFLLSRQGYKVKCASFLSDALDLIRLSSFDLFLVNDELACGSGKEFLNKLRHAAGSTPVVFYSNIVYPYSPRSMDQSGSTPETPVPATEVGLAVHRALANVSRPLNTCIKAA